MIVMMIASTPSLNASRRLGLIVKPSMARGAPVEQETSCRTLPRGRRTARRERYGAARGGAVGSTAFGAAIFGTGGIVTGCPNCH